MQFMLACGTAIRLDPNRADFYIGRGRVFREKGSLDRALADYDDAIRLDPKKTDSYISRGNAWFAKGDLDQALDDYDAAIRLDPNQADSDIGHGRVIREKGNLGRALIHYDEAIRLDPNQAVTAGYRGLALDQKGENAFPENGAAPLSDVFGAGFPPAAPTGRPLEACTKPFMSLREEAEKLVNMIKAASERKAPPGEACNLIGNFGQTELKMIEYVESNSASCGIPPQIAERLKANHNNTEAWQKKVCTVAERWKDYSYAMRVTRNGREAEIAGDFKHGLTKDFLKLLAASPQIKVVHLDSPGGFVNEAVALNKVIRSKGLDTYVSSECISACTIAFAGGRRRILRQGAVLGFHGPTSPSMTKQQLAESLKLQRKIFRILVAAGFDGKFVDQAFSTPHSELWKPSAAVLLQAGAITAVSDGSEAFSGTVGMNRDAVDQSAKTGDE